MHRAITFNLNSIIIAHLNLLSQNIKFKDISSKKYFLEFQFQLPIVKFYQTNCSFQFRLKKKSIYESICNIIIIGRMISIQISIFPYPIGFSNSNYIWILSYIFLELQGFQFKFPISQPIKFCNSNSNRI